MKLLLSLFVLAESLIRVALVSTKGRSKTRKAVREILTRLRVKAVGTPDKPGAAWDAVAEAYRQAARDAQKAQRRDPDAPLGARHQRTLQRRVDALTKRLDTAIAYVARDVDGSFSGVDEEIPEIKGFTDKAGRRWDLAVYARMCAQTTAAQAMSAATINSALDGGQDLVKVSRHPHSRDACTPFEGRVFSISGQSTRFPKLEEMPPFHPNCKHRLRPYTRAELAEAHGVRRDRQGGVTIDVDSPIISSAEQTIPGSSRRSRRPGGGIDPNADNVMFDPSGILIVDDPDKPKPSDADLVSLMRAYPDAIDLLWGDEDITLKESAPEDEEFDRYGRRIGVTDHPIGADIEVGPGGALGEAMNDALAAIDKVHRDGAKRSIDMRSSSANDIEGEFVASRRDPFNDEPGRPQHIAISRNADEPRLTAIHEVGHYLDYEAMGGSAENFATNIVSQEDAKATGRIVRAMKNSDLGKRLKDMRENPDDYTVHIPDPKVEDKVHELKPDGAFLDYLDSESEMFARAYSQYIAVRSGDATLRAELDRRRAQETKHGYPQQWTDEDFGPIAEAFDRVFGELEWLT